jgi:hypothetical protein
VLALAFLCIFNIVALINNGGGSMLWMIRSIPSNIPYLSLLFLNTGQAIIAVFLSSEFLKADKKLDTSEVFYVHPLSNAEYVIGKIWGNMKVFFRLNFYAIAVVFVFNLASGIVVDWLSYIVYFLIISVPTLVFIFGLSVSLMLIIKNQAITFVILLGYIALTLFYISDKFYYLFDYMVYNLPLVKSLIVGFTNTETLINHRLIYLFLGLGFICISIFLFRRLPNTKYGRYRWLVIAGIFISLGIYSGYKHVSNILKNSSSRASYMETNNNYLNKPRMVIDAYDIKVDQHPSSISSEAVMKGIAQEASSSFIFCLNPALQVSEVSENAKELSFQRDNQIIVVDFGRRINEGDTVTFSMKYEGSIDGEFCYLDVPDEFIQQIYSLEILKIDKRYSFQTPDYVLFTPETYWYPRPGTSYSSLSPDWQQSYFSKYRLKIKTLNGLTALSQGSMTRDRDSLFVYETDFPTPAVSLIIGDYEQKSAEVDSTLFSVWYIKGHDYFSSVLDSIADTIPSLIRIARTSIETTYSLNYSFKRFSVVEVPVQFYSYAHTWTQAHEKMQPEMTLYPEKGCLFGESDFKYRIGNEKRWAGYDGRELSDADAAMRVFNGFVRGFSMTESNFNWTQTRGVVNISTQSNPYLFFPQLYNFRYNTFSSEWSIANRLIELYLQDKQETNNWLRQTNGISNSEKANLMMEQRPFKELLSDVEQRDLLDYVIALKANYLFAPGERNLGYKEYRDSLRAVLVENAFTNLQFENLLETMGKIAGEDFVTPLKLWDKPTELPVYVVGTPEVMLISNRDVDVYVVKLQITNDSDVDGIINIEINVGGGGGFGGGGGGRGGGGGGFGGGGGGGGGNRGAAIYDPKAKRKLSIAAHETKQIVSTWDEAPRNITINTLISANLPNIMTIPLNNIIRERNRTIDKEGDFIINNVSFLAPGEVIVDNEDSTLFEVSKPDIVGLLPKWLEEDNNTSFRYSGVSDWRPPLQWTLTTSEKYYGTHVRSAYVIKSGSGNQKATWKLPVPSSGQYDVFYYATRQQDMRVSFGRGGGGGGGGGGGAGGRGGDRQGGNRGNAEYKFKVIYDRDEEDAYINLRRIDNGWNLLGSYYFSDDTVKVVLSNECELQSVVADAVKIVKR